MGFDVVGLGLNATDVAIEVPHYPAFNSKLEFSSARWQPGGQVATALTVCQRLGLKTKYIGRVGDDAMGGFQLESLRPEGIDLTDAKVVADCANQCAYIVIEQGSGERTILWRRDPRLTIQPEEVRREMIAGARQLHVDGHDTAAAARLAAWAREAGLPVTADVDNVYSGLPALLDSVSHLISSAAFPAAYTGEQDYFRALPEILRRHPQMKLVGATLGHDGVLALQDAQFLYAPAYAVRCRDTTGAGDVFHGAFAFGLLAGWPTLRVLEFSNAVAGLNSEAIGARGGIPTQAAAEELMARGERRAARWPGLVEATRGGR
ncbi:MAG: carbohydrate kinase family protein [Candidatus Acidiferrales bacterium]